MALRQAREPAWLVTRSGRRILDEMFVFHNRDRVVPGQPISELQARARQKLAEGHELRARHVTLQDSVVKE